MTAIVYRKLPDIPHRQYVLRIVGGYWLGTSHSSARKTEIGVK